MSPNNSRLPARLTVALVGLFLLLLAIHFASVALTRYLVEKTLHPALPQGTYIGEMHLNLLTGLLEVEDFRLQNEGQLWIRAGRTTLDINPWRLLAGRLHIEHLDIENAYLRVERQPDGGFDLGLPPFGADGPPDGDSEPLPLSLAGALVRRFAVDYHDGELTSFLYIDSLEVGAYSLAAEQQDTEVSWNLRWDERLLAGDAEIAIDNGQIAIDGSLRTDPLDLAHLQRLARLPESASGQLAYEGAFAWQPPRLMLDGALRAPALVYAADGQHATLDALELPAFALAVTTEPMIDVDLTLEQPLRVGMLSWQATEHRGAEAQGLVLSSRLTGRLDGELALGATEFTAEKLVWWDAGREVQLATLDLKGELKQMLAGGLPRLAADVAVESLRYRDVADDLVLAVDGMRLDALRLDAVEDAGQQRSLSGRVSLARSRLDSAGTGVAWDDAAFETSGSLTVDAVRIGGDLDVSGLQIELPAFGQPLRLRQVSATGLDLGEQSRFETLKFDGLHLASTSPETALSVASIRLDQGAYSAQQGVVVDEIVIDSLQTGVIRDGSGEWLHPLSVTSRDEGVTAESISAAKAADGQGKAEVTPWRIGGVRMTGESHVTAADYLNPDMSKPRFKIERLRLGALSSAAPGDDTPFEVTLRPDRFSEFVIDGHVRPLAEHFYIKAEGHLQGYGLTTVNGLVANDLGHRFLAGQLDNDFDISIEDNRLLMSNKLSLAGVDVEAIEGKDGPPLGTAIALLEDRDGNIKLEVPVDGNLEDPNFRVLGALNPIIMKAVAGTAALAIQPLGSVLLVGSLLADQALKVTFEPALFEAGAVDLNPAARDYLGQLAGKLAEKPKLAVRLCGVVAGGERKKDKNGAYLDQEADLLQVAQRRADAVRRYLNAQGAAKKQLRACRPALDQGVEAKPRVDIKF